jgi:hypothetical protein
MNCFNIRELQGILKRKFFVDLVNSHDHRSLLDKSMIGLRYKSNLNSNTNLDITSFYNLGLSENNMSKVFFLHNQNASSSNSKYFVNSTNNNGPNLYPLTNNLDYFFLIFADNKFYLQDLIKCFNISTKSSVVKLYEQV